MAAWGSEKFEITFEAGGYGVTVSRVAYRGKVKDDFRVKFNEPTKQSYLKCLESAAATRKKVTGDEDVGFEFSWRVYESVSKSARDLMGKDAIWTQSFIPAGRSFFTSIGKAVIAFEQGGMLDPITVRFGRIFANSKDRGYRYYAASSKKELEKITTAFADIFGGELKVDGDREYVLTSDGREVPLSALSSGQQELLPLITILPHLVNMRMLGEKGGTSTRLVYIEEMEAHLFPQAQSRMVEVLAMLRSMNAKRLGIVLTTHSPYVLAKINNLIYAGQLGNKRDENLKKSVEGVIKKDSWLIGNAVTAYAIKDRNLVKIIDKDGFIDGDYLDAVSGDIAKEFSALQELEYGDR
ncbi:hypothetical protein GCM10009125_28710 [Castellaniella daejeonensis]|uniref:Endonuclease GajA/Old nuclease/RecF-like AAA domain-containing protein n=1 Tax=Castellaniella daejeonensis TaxID=659013 RepID=A0ABN0U479_9BURK